MATPPAASFPPAQGVVRPGAASNEVIAFCGRGMRSRPCEATDKERTGTDQRETSTRHSRLTTTPPQGGSLLTTVPWWTLTLTPTPGKLPSSPPTHHSSTSSQDYNHRTAHRRPLWILSLKLFTKIN